MHSRRRCPGSAPPHLRASPRFLVLRNDYTFEECEKASDSLLSFSELTAGGCLRRPKHSGVGVVGPSRCPVILEAPAAGWTRLSQLRVAGRERERHSPTSTRGSVYTVGCGWALGLWVVSSPECGRLRPLSGAAGPCVYCTQYSGYGVRPQCPLLSLCHLLHPRFTISGGCTS